MLGYIRTAEESYRLENNKYTGDWDDLDVDVQSDCSSGRQYFSYSLSGISDSTFTATATRCISAESKSPPGKTAYTLILNQDGNLSVEEGY